MESGGTVVTPDAEIEDGGIIEEEGGGRDGSGGICGETEPGATESVAGEVGAIDPGAIDSGASESGAKNSGATELGAIEGETEGA